MWVQGAAQSALAQEVTFCMLPLGGSSAEGGEGADDHMYKRQHRALFEQRSVNHAPPVSSAPSVTS